MKKTRFLSFLPALALLFGSFSTEVRAESDGPEFLHDFDEAVAASEESGKPTVVIFSASWCPPCQQMKRGVYPSETVQPYHDKFVWAYLDADDPKNGPVSQKFGVSGIPHVAFLQPGGEPIGYFKGGVSPDTFVEVLEKALEATEKENSEDEAS